MGVGLAAINADRSASDQNAVPGSVFAANRSLIAYCTTYTTLGGRDMSEVARKIRNAALIAVVIPAALVAACAPQPAPPPPQPVA